MRKTKNTTLKRITSVLLSAVMLLSSVQSVFAVAVESFTDFPTGWSRPAMEAAVDNGLLVGFENNEIRPKNNLTRAEMAAIITRAFGAITMADISAYKDVSYEAWYYESIAKAVKMGAMTGKSTTEMCPDCNITREEAFSIIGRVLALSDTDTSSLTKFHDAANISSWATGNIAALVRRGYVNGDNFGYLNPKANITREEFAQVMYTTIKKYITEAGTYSEPMQGIVVLRTGNINLANMAVNGDLVVGDGAMKLAVKLDNVTTNGRLLTRGGTMTLRNTTVSDGVVVLNPNGITHFNNYRNENVFAGINEITRASFLSGTTIQTGGSSGSGIAVRHYVTFKLDEDDTEAYAKIRVTRGSKIGSNMPDAPTKVGYTFDGWFDENGDEVTADTRVTEAMVVTAQFSLIEYDITFKNDDDTPFSYFIDGYLPENKFDIETLYTLPDASKVSRTGYTFVGWVDASGNPVTEVTVTADTPDSGLTLYADFEVIDYPISYKNDDGTAFSYFVGGYAPVDTYNIETPYTLPDASKVKRTGYSFVGWVDANDDPVTQVLVTDETTDAGMELFADFELVDYPVNYKNSDGTAFSYFVDGYAPVATHNIETPYTLPDASKVYRKGYTFNGWVDASGNPAVVEVTDATTDAGTDVYADFSIINYTLFFDADFKDGSDGKSVNYTVENYASIVFPGENEVEIPAGKESFIGWYLGDTKIDALDESFITDTAGVITLVAKFSDEVTPPPSTSPSTPPSISPESHKVVFKLNSSDIDNYAEFEVVDGEPIDSKMPANPSVTGYSFEGWFDQNGTQVTANTEVREPLTVTARLTLIEFPIYYKDEAGNAFTFFVGADPEDTFNIETQYDLPDANDIYRKGYTFNGWLDADGDPVTRIEVTDETPLTGITLYADFTINEYTVRFEAEFTDGDLYKEIVYTILNYSRVEFPKQSDLVIPDGKESLLGWYTAGGVKVTFLDDSFITDIPGTIILTPRFSDEVIEPAETIKVTFYLGHGDYKIYLEERTLELNSQGVAQITEAQVPSYPQAGTDVLSKSKYMPSNYPDYRGVLRVTPTFWYEVDGKLVPFDAPVELTKDTDVHLMYQNFALNANVTELPPAAISTKYSDETRLLDSAKVLGDSAVNWFKLARTYPKYNEIVDLGISKLVEKDIMDENRNLKMLYIPLKISQFTTEEVANEMVKSRIREMIAHPDDLNELLDFAHIDELIQYIDKDSVISGLTDEQILALMVADENRAMVTNYIVSDLQKTDSVLMEAVLDYISSSLATDGDLRLELVTQLKTKMAGTDANAKKLRQMILKSDSIGLLLTNPSIEAKIVDMILDTESGIIDVILADETLAKELIEEVSHYPLFVDEIVKTQQFKNYVIPLIQIGGAEYHNVTEAILNSATAKREILDAVEESQVFKNLVQNNVAVRNEILSSITVDYEVDIDDVVKFVFEIDGATDYSSLVDTTAIDAYFDTLPGFDLAVTMYGSRKAAKNELYNDGSVRATVKAKIETEYGDVIDQHVADYIANNKEVILDTFISNKTALDPAVLTTIENKMIDFVKRYVDKDTTLNSEIAAVIEADILSYISKMITGPVPTDPDLAAVKAELDADMEYFISVAHENPQIVQVIKNFINSHHDSDMAAIVDSVYADFVPSIAAYIKGLDVNSDNYKALDETVRTAAGTLDAAVLSDFIKGNSTNADILALLEEYIADPANEDDIVGYVDTFIEGLTVSFVTTYRALINEMLSTLDLEAIIGNDEDKFIALIKEYISLLDSDEKEDLADEIYDAISATEEYKTLMEHMFKMDEIVVTPGDIPYVKAISHAIRDLSVEEAIKFTKNSYIEKLVDFIGEDFISDRFNETRDRYCDGLDEVIEIVESGASNYKTYTTSLEFRLNPIDDVLVKLYDKAQPIAEEKLMNANIYYEDNEYLQYIVEHDVIGRLVTGDGVVNGEFIGYAIKDEAEYAEYVMEMLIAADDAICWYGDEDEIDPEKVDAIFDAVVLKAQIVHDKLNAMLEEYLATGELPEKAQQAIEKVQRVNDLFLKYESKLKEVIEKYLAHSINDKIEDGSIAENEKIQTAIDILLGREDPVFTIDCLYDIFYKYDDKLQAKLKKLIDSGKLEAAIDKAFDKAQSTDKITDRVDDAQFEKLEKIADKLYAILVDVANNGIDKYRVITNDPTIIDKYELRIGENVFTMTRSLQ